LPVACRPFPVKNGPRLVQAGPRWPDCAAWASGASGSRAARRWPVRPARLADRQGQKRRRQPVGEARVPPGLAVACPPRARTEGTRTPRPGGRSACLRNTWGSLSTRSSSELQPLQPCPRSHQLRHPMKPESLPLRYCQQPRTLTDVSPIPPDRASADCSLDCTLLATYLWQNLQGLSRSAAEERRW
jgi:hypothetical protein